MMLGETSVPGVPLLWIIIVVQRLIVLSIGAGRGCCVFSIAPTISFIVFLSVGDGSKKTGILSQRAVFKPKASNQPMAIKTMF